MFGTLLGSLIVTLLACTILAAHLWPYRRAVLPRKVLFTQACYILWCVSLLAAMTLETLPEKMFATHVRQLLLPLLVPTWLMLTVVLFLPDLWRKIGKWRLVIYVFPFIVILGNFLEMVGWPPAQGWIFYDFQTMPGLGGLPSFKRGPLLKASLTYGLVALGIQYAVYLYSVFKYQGSRRVHALCLMGGGVLPVLLELVGHGVYGDLRFSQMTVVAMWPTIIALYLAVSRLELLDVTALAMERIFEELPGPVLILNPQGELWGMNRNAKIQLGLTSSCLGKRALDIPAMSEIMTSADQGGAYESQGRNYQIEKRELTLRDDDVKASVFSLMDVTDLEQSNRTLREMNQEVLQLARFNNRIQSVLSHDLAGSLSGVQLLLKSVQQQSASEAMKNAIDANQASIGLLKSLLSWSQNEGQRQKINLRDRVCTAIDQVKPQILEKRITVRKELPEGEVLVQGSGMVVEAIVRNLVSNAVKYSPSDSEIMVRADLNGGCVRLMIDDQGGGIGEDVLQMLEDSSKRRIPSDMGFGLGLKLTNDFVAQMGGKMNFETRENSGTRVHVQLPLFD